MNGECGLRLIVDHDRSARELMREHLQADGHSSVEVSTGEEALLVADELQPALVILNVELPGLSGYGVCRRLRERFGQRLPIIFVSAIRTEAMDRVAGLLVGADDYIVKPFVPDELVARAWRAIVRSTAENGDRRPARETDLTPREREVLRLLAEGLSPKVIAAQLFISPKTVATHIQRILTKLDVHSRAEAVALAFQSGLVLDATARDRRGEGFIEAS